MLSFVTINYNGLSDTRTLLRSIAQHVHSVPYEVIVVDNGSQNNEAQTLQQEFPDVRVLPQSCNLGFAGGNNRGIQAARGEWVMLINNDTYIFDDHFDRLLEYMQQHPQVGAITPLLCYNTQPPTVQWAGYTPLSSITLRNQAIGQGRAPQEYTQPSPTPLCHGAAMLVRRQAIERAGLMPTVYFLYYEEIDWCCRIAQAGYTMAFVPYQTIIHCESRATGLGSPLKAYYLTRGRLLFARRNRSGMARIMAIAYQLCAVLPRNLLLHLRRPAHFKATIRGTWHGLKHPITNFQLLTPNS